MSKTVQVNVTIDVTNPSELEALNVFLGVIGGQPTVTGQVKKIEKPVKDITVVDAKVVEPAKKAETTESVPAETAAAAKEEKKESKIKIDELRDLTSVKAIKHKVAIKNKLTELGSNNVTSLDPSKFEIYHDYLNSLD